jgi:hypothetical protein
LADLWKYTALRSGEAGCGYTVALEKPRRGILGTFAESRYPSNIEGDKWSLGKQIR